MSDVQEKPRTRDRRPEEVPHHPKVLTAAWIVVGAALVLMIGWFWSVTTGGGFILSAEKENAAAVRAQEEAEAEQAAEADQTEGDLARQQEEAEQGDGTTGSRRGGPPPAPEFSDTVTDELELQDWSILSVNGVLNVGGQLTNLTSEPLTGEVRIYVYTDGVPVATATTEVVNLAPGTPTKVNLVSDSDWEAGEKVILLDFVPRR